MRLFKFRTVRGIIRNLPGWRTSRKFIVFESDDWGSIRMSSRSSYNKLIEKGFPIKNDHYNINDGLEASSDLESLFETLDGFKDSTNRSPVFTGLNLVANPDFEKIRSNNFETYYWEPITDSYNRNSRHYGVQNLWQEGINNRLFIPEFHGREHLNVRLWLKDLKEGKRYTLAAFEERVTGIPPIFENNRIRNYQAAFDVENDLDVRSHIGVIEDGISLFKNLYGYKPRFFVPPNGPFNTSLEKTAVKNGIEYLGVPKIHKEPIGNNQFKKHYRFLGNQSALGLTYLTRNAFFEPSSTEVSSSKDWVSDCIQDIEIAFMARKPAIISTHRVNYIGWLNSKNKEKGLGKLNELLTRILKKWPDVEFVTSTELGDMIKGKGTNA